MNLDIDSEGKGEYFSACEFAQGMEAGAYKGRVNTNYFEKYCKKVDGCETCGRKEKHNLEVELNISI